MPKFLCVLLLLCCAAAGQVIDASSAGEPVRLQGNWRFNAGDNPAWSKADFDDSAWRLVSTQKTWDEQGLQSVRGYVWFRTRVKLPARNKGLTLLVKESGPYDLYLNGVKAGTFGKFPPHPVLFADAPKTYAIPAGISDVQIAIRYWIFSLIFHVEKLASDLTIGPADSIKDSVHVSVDALLVQDMPDAVIFVMSLILGAGLVVLFMLQRERTEYIFLALVMFMSFLSGAGADYRQIVPIRGDQGDYWNVVTQGLVAIFMIEFLFRFLGQRVPILFRVYQALLSLLWVAVFVGWSGWANSPVLNVLLTLVFAPYWFSLPSLLFWKFARGNKESGLLAVPILLFSLDSMASTLGWVLFELHLRATYTPFVKGFYIGEVLIAPGNIDFLLFLLSIGALILVRFQKTRTAKTRAEAELEAARNMQEVMVPKRIEAPGFVIETAYFPAAEVGGDFFQLFPDDEGGLTVVIGDVSGKGLRAAMLVSMIVGSLRRTVALTRSPAQILRDLNAMLIGHTDEKFATCCCAFIRPDGSMTAANAGHLSPYCDGQEIELPPGLPLGVSADATYEEVRLAKPRGKRWVFMSDGVVEARNKTGELYGFERTRVISIEPVSQIAEAAQRFGQEDDITVLSVQPAAAFLN